MSDSKKQNKELLQYAGLASQWLAMIGIALWAGIWIDKQISQNSRIATIALPLLAIILSLWRLIIKFNKPKNEE